MLPNYFEIPDYIIILRIPEIISFRENFVVEKIRNKKHKVKRCLFHIKLAIKKKLQHEY